LLRKKRTKIYLANTISEIRKLNTELEAATRQMENYLQENSSLSLEKSIIEVTLLKTI